MFSLKKKSFSENGKLSSYTLWGNLTVWLGKFPVIKFCSKFFSYSFFCVNKYSSWGSYENDFLYIFSFQYLFTLQTSTITTRVYCVLFYRNWKIFAMTFLILMKVNLLFERQNYSVPIKQHNVRDSF